jgi:hypothetical protein
LKSALISADIAVCPFPPSGDSSIGIMTTKTGMVIVGGEGNLIALLSISGRKMRIKKVRVSRELMVDFFTEGRVFKKSECLMGLPSDAVLCGVELLADVLLLAFTHPSFEDLLEGVNATEIIPLYRYVEEI